MEYLKYADSLWFIAICIMWFHQGIITIQRPNKYLFILTVINSLFFIWKVLFRQ